VSAARSTISWCCLGLLLPGCWLSYAEQSGEDAGRDVVPDRGDSPLDVADAPHDLPDAPADAPTDEAEAETIDAVAACLYEPVGGELRVGEGDLSTDAPRIFWTGSELAVTMFASSGGGYGHSYVGISSVPADLSSHTPLRSIGEESHGWGEVAPTGDGFGLCWHADPGYDSATYFRRHAMDGTPVTTWSPFDPDGEACLALVHAGGRFAVAWRHWNVEGEESFIDSRVGVLDGSGTLVATPIDLGIRQEYPGRTPLLAANGPEFLVGWPASDGVELHRLTADGAPTLLGTLPATGAVNGKLAVADDRLALAWLSGERDHRGLRFQVFGTDLRPREEPLWIEEDGAGASNADVVPVPDGWVLLWHRGSYPDEQVAMVLHLDPDGLPREPRRTLYVGVNSGYGGPSGAAVDDELFVGLSHYPDGSGLEQVFVRRFDCVPGERDVCAAQDADIPVRCADELALGWKWDGSQCLELRGCETDCVGADCDRLARSRWDCLSDRQLCSYGGGAA
jgi:hypothetical protein